MTYVLAFDTAMAGCSVCVLNTANESAVAETRIMARGQSEELIPMIDNAVKKAGISFHDLNLIVTTVGPGAFTGLRIGLSAARSFGLALDIPVAGVTTTEILAKKYLFENSALEGDLLVLIETKRSDLYFQPYKASGQAEEEAGVASIEAILERFGNRKMILLGDGVIRLHETLDSQWPTGWKAVTGYDLPDPVIMAHLGQGQYSFGLSRPAKPLYLRGADVSQSNRPQRTIAGIEE